MKGIASSRFRKKGFQSNSTLSLPDTYNKRSQPNRHTQWKNVVGIRARTAAIAICIKVVNGERFEMPFYKCSEYLVCVGARPPTNQIELDSTAA
jgi:hypothetical protein